MWLLTQYVLLLHHFAHSKPASAIPQDFGFANAFLEIKREAHKPMILFVDSPQSYDPNRFLRSGAR